MEQFLNPRVKEIQISGIRQFTNYVATLDNVISLTLGQPDFPTPYSVKEGAKQAIDENKTTYTVNAGLLELRQAASDFVRDQYGLTYHPETEILTTIGASQAIDIALRTILTPGVEVIIPAPVYPGYEPIVRLAGAIPVFIDTTKTDFVLTKEALEAAITDKTRCLILPYPSNPIGVTMTREQLGEIASVLTDKNIFVLSDEIYSELVYDGTHTSIAHFPEMREKTIIINGLSKSHSMTGWRIGNTFAPAYLTKEMVKVHQYNVTCATSISQYGAIAAYQDRESTKIMRDTYKERRDYTYKRIQKMGLPVVKPTGAFYLFVNISQFGLVDFDFAKKLVDEERLAVIPGSAFAPFGEGYIRLSYSYSLEMLEEGLNRLERFIGG